MFSEAWTLASLDYGAGQIRSGFTLLALLTSDELARTTREISKELQLISVEALRQDFSAIVERPPNPPGRRPGRAKKPGRPAPHRTLTSTR